MTTEGDPSVLLSDLVRAVEVPDAVRGQAAAAAWQDAEGWGRLRELAVWWAGVRPPDSGDTGGLDVAVVVPGVAAAGDDVSPLIASAVPAGASTAEAGHRDGRDLMVLRCTDQVSARALACSYLGLDPVGAAGWPQPRGRGMVPADDEWAWRIAAVQARLRGAGHVDRSTDPARLFTVMRAPEAAWAAGFLLRAAGLGLPVLLDGEATLAVAALVRWACPGSVLWWQVADTPPSPAAAALLADLDLRPVLDLGCDQDDASAGRLAVSILGRALDLHRDLHRDGTPERAEQPTDAAGADD